MGPDHVQRSHFHLKAAYNRWMAATCLNSQWGTTIKMLFVALFFVAESSSSAIATCPRIAASAMAVFQECFRILGSAPEVRSKLTVRLWLMTT